MKKISAIAVFAILAGAASCNDESDERGEQDVQDEEEAEVELDDGDETSQAADEAVDEGVDEAADEGADDAVEVGFAELVEGFEASQDEWMDRWVTLTGAYFTTNSANDEIQNIIIVKGEDHDMGEDTSVTCTFAESPDEVDLMQYDEVTVTGKVDEFFDDPALMECSIVE